MKKELNYGNRVVVQTDQAPKAIGTYSQAIKVDNTVADSIGSVNNGTGQWGY